MAAMITIANSNALHIPLPDRSVQCVVTSPPYYGLRDYGTAKWEGGSAECDHVANPSATKKFGNPDFNENRPSSDETKTAGYFKDICPRCGARRIDAQIGLESTPAAYVANIIAVMRECKRVLKDDGVLFLNLGDSYFGDSPTRKSGAENFSKEWDKTQTRSRGGLRRSAASIDGLKPKDLIGIPWMVARALQQPFYTGRISEEKDRVWLAAIIDAEGTICGFTHQRKDDGNIRTGVHVAITNSNRKLLDEAHRIWPASLSDHGRPGNGHLGKMETWRWIAHNVDDKSILMREMYPYLIAKKKQALLAYNLFEISKDAKRLGKSSEAKATHEKRALIVSLISKLNHLEDVDIPGWCIEPPSLYEPGWYLRQDIIWSKPNPMPESVTDRCTKAHEYVFLLTKQARYFFDNEAIKESASTPLDSTARQSFGGPKLDDSIKAHAANNGKAYRDERDGNRNRRSVWTVATSPYSGAHFATFPPALIEPMILAGTSARGECPHCGKAWLRVVEKIESDNPTGYNGSKFTNGKTASAHPNTGNGSRYESKSIGWNPQCSCPPHEPIPQTVLDPFAGSGTTGAVAVKHGRRAVLLDLNTKYIDLQFERTNGVQMTMPV